MLERAVDIPAKKAHLWSRVPHDWYVEPAAATEALLTRERFIGQVWDPACGQGNIVKTLTRAGIVACGTDIEDRGLSFVEGFLGKHDFLSDALPSDRRFRLPPNIACNPPFFRAVGAEAFIRRALKLATGKVAMFVDLRFLSGAKRAASLYADHPPTRIYVLSKRPSCPPGDVLLAGGKAEGGTADWVWLVWDQSAPRSDTRLIWLAPDRGGVE